MCVKCWRQEGKKFGVDKNEYCDTIKKAIKFMKKAEKNDEDRETILFKQALKEIDNGNKLYGLVLAKIQGELLGMEKLLRNATVLSAKDLDIGKIKSKHSPHGMFG